MNPIAGQITLILILVILILPRRWAALGIVAGVCYLTQSQFMVVAGVDFTPIRFIIFVGFIRVVILRKEFSFSKLNNIDKSFLLFSSIFFLTYFSRSYFISPYPAEISYRLGVFIDSLMSYFIFRGLINDTGTFRQFLKDVSLLIIPFTIFVIIEGATGRNLFALLGGVPETPMFRDGYYRSQGSFRHAITAGSLGATFLPMFIVLAVSSVTRYRAVVGIISCLSIVVASHSSGPLLALLCSIIAWIFWPFRRRMRIVRWSVVGILILLHLVMKAPVWFIYARLSDIIGGGGWHRANLIDKFVNNFQDWWLLGMPIQDTYHWAATRHPWGGVDVTNEFVSIGIGGGLISLMLFIWLFKNCYRYLGIAMEKIRGEVNKDSNLEIMFWGLGSALFSHMMNLTSVTYWDQFWVMWYMLLAAISSLTYYIIGESTLSVKETQIVQSVSSTLSYHNK